MIYHRIKHAHPQSGAHCGVSEKLHGQVLVQLGPGGGDHMALEHEQIRLHRMGGYANWRAASHCDRRRTISADIASFTGCKRVMCWSGFEPPDDRSGGERTKVNGHSTAGRTFL